MADPRTARPVSGEIMTGVSAAPHASRPSSISDDLVDADFEVLPPARPSSPKVAVDDRRGDLNDGMDMLRGAGDASAPNGFLARGGPLFWISGALLVLAAFWISGGHQLFGDALSRSAGESARMLVISDVASRVDVSGPKPILFVDGQAGNPGSAVAVMPELAISVTGKDGRVTRYNLGTSGRTMRPGEKFAFSSRLDLPKNGVETVSVTFAE